MPLILRRASEHHSHFKEPKPQWPDDHFVVLSGGLIVGSIFVLHGGPSNGLWRWAISGASSLAPGMELCGHVETLAQAKAALADNWRKWLVFAGLREGA